MPKMLAQSIHKQGGYILWRDALPKHNNKYINKAMVKSGTLIYLYSVKKSKILMLLYVILMLLCCMTQTVRDQEVRSIQGASGALRGWGLRCNTVNSRPNTDTIKQYSIGQKLPKLQQSIIPQMPVPWDEQPEGETSPMVQEIAVVFLCVRQWWRKIFFSILSILQCKNTLLQVLPSKCYLSTSTKV